MKLGYTILFVADVAKTIAFWERAFGLKRRMIVESGLYGELETGATALGFVQQGFMREQLPYRAPVAGEAAPPFEIALVTDDVEAAQARALEAGATLVQKPTKKPWGQVVAHVRDLDGNLVELCTPMG